MQRFIRRQRFTYVAGVYVQVDVINAHITCLASWAVALARQQQKVVSGAMRQRVRTNDRPRDLVPWRARRSETAMMDAAAALAGGR